jgi:hypothetical protein
MSTTKAFIHFLATYGPTSAAQSMYDEHVLEGARHFEVEPISVETDKIGQILEALSGQEPRSVILTGTAGDGKTWHCRRVYTTLVGTEEEWRLTECLIEARLSNGRRLVILKDLSQYHGKPEQDEIVRGLFRSAYGEDEAVYLIAANDGQLLRTLRRYALKDASGRRAEEAIRNLLKNDKSRTPDLRLDMWNLSRQPHDETFERLLDAVLNHLGWGDCAVCASAPFCPIRRNGELLKQTAAVGLRARMRDMIRIATDNEMHLPIRQVLLVVVNTLLGVHGLKSPLMDCQSASSLVSEGKLSASNPYDNVFGLNLEADRATYKAFGILSSFGVGQETNNLIDGLLIDEDPQDAHSKYVADDPVFGEALFKLMRRQYQRGEAVDPDEFRHAIEQQRRRLFFRLPPQTLSQSDLDPWRLTVFTHGGEYLAFADALRRGQVDAKTRARLAVGLNRTYTGMMCDDGASLWFAAPTANAQSRIGQVLDIETPVGERKTVRVHFDFDAGGPHRTLRMVVCEGKEVVETNPLQPLLFEYLLRVEGGSLPGSFSRQCFEELRQFRMRVAASLEKRGLIDSEGVEDIQIVRLSPEGRLSSDEIGIVAVES